MVSLPLYENDPPEAADGAHSGCQADGGDQPRCGNGLEKVYNTTAVRYGFMRHIGEFSYPAHLKFTCGAKTVIQTRRGIEIGEQVSLSCNGCDKHVSREQIKTYIENSGSDSYLLESGRILREASADDLAENLRLRESARRMRSSAQSRADDCLGARRMKIVECEFLLGGERAIFYFTSEGRVDFRNLVKELSREFQTRIQMHQVGARDEARLLADFETCGREICCKVFLKTLKPISMRMAKLQRATLDPTKVSGRCGRLKCCLRYEHESYESMDARLPKKGEKIRTVSGYGTVTKRQVLTQLVQIDLADEGGMVTVVVEDVLERDVQRFPPKPEPAPPRQARSTARKGASRRRATSKSQEPSRSEPTNRMAGSQEARASGPAAAKATRGSAPQESTAPKRRRRRRSRTRRRGTGPSGSGDTPPTAG
ncbi:MAG: regulatory iron-sulfur-containing complex subunit RicT [Phycisphaerae bacterium]